MIREHRGAVPRVDPDAFVAPDAVVCGDVVVGEGSAVLAGAVLTAEGGAVRIGRHVVVMEHAVLRGTPSHPCAIGNHVLIGPRVHLSGCRVEDLSFLATGVTILNGASVGAMGDVRLHSVVHANTRLPPATTVPIGWVAVGDPAEIHPPEAHDAIRAVQRTLGFRDTAFGMRGLPRAAFMRRMTRRYAEALALHRGDRMVTGAGKLPLGDRERTRSAWLHLWRRLWRGPGARPEGR